MLYILAYFSAKVKHKSVITLVKLKKFKKSWKKHRHFVITGGQIITILGIIAGVLTTYWQVHQNTDAITNVNQFVGNTGGNTNFVKFHTDFTNLQRKVELQGQELDLLINVLTNIEVVPDEPTTDSLNLKSI